MKIGYSNSDISEGINPVLEGVIKDWFKKKFSKKDNNSNESKSQNQIDKSLLKEIISNVKSVMREIASELDDDEKLKEQMQKDLNEAIESESKGKNEEEKDYIRRKYNNGKAPKIVMKIYDEREQRITFTVFDTVDDLPNYPVGEVCSPLDKIETMFNKKVNSEFISHIDISDDGNDPGTIIVSIY